VDLILRMNRRTEDRKMRVLIAAFAALALTASAQPLLAENPDETQAFVRELAAFHEVIYPLWHTAWPSKDTTLVRELWPDVQRHIAAVTAAELPGILRDKRAAWQKGLERLGAAEAAYGAALDGGTMEAKLAVVEELHAAFESLVRTIQPVLPELAGFHEVLYRIYHYDLPNEDRKSLVERLPALTAEMDTLNAAVLPERRANAKEKFEAARADLSAKVDVVARVAPEGEWAETAKAIEEMHAAYQAVEKVFD
jgi:hypothetical protein